MIAGYIYKLYWPNGEHERIYIGKTGNIKDRTRMHYTNLRCCTHSNKALQAAYNQCKVLPVLEVIEEVETESLLSTRENYYISQFREICFNFQHSISKKDKRRTVSLTLSPKEVIEITGNSKSLSEGIRSLIAQNNQMLNELKQLKK